MNTLYPILDTDALDMLKVFAVVSHHHEPLGLCCAANKQVEVVNLLSCLPERSSLFGKGMNGFVERDNLHFCNKLFHLPEIILNPVTVVGTKQKFSHHSVCNIALVFVYLIESFLNTAFSSEQEHTDAGVKQISFHSSTSNVLVVRAERMSLTISSAERESFHVPAKRLAQPFLCEAVCSSATVMELLNRAISSIFSVLLKSLSSDQYRALAGDVTFKPFMLIYILVCYSAAKISNFLETPSFY